jgi:hypothetical protein
MCMPTRVGVTASQQREPERDRAETARIQHPTPEQPRPFVDGGTGLFAVGTLSRGDLFALDVALAAIRGVGRVARWFGQRQRHLSARRTWLAHLDSVITDSVAWELER